MVPHSFKIELMALTCLPILLTSCFAWYGDVRSPLKESAIAQIEPGVTTREKLVELFGQPHVSRAHDSLWFYVGCDEAEESRSYGYNGTGICGWDWLLVQFRDDTVVFSESFLERGHKLSCASNGICRTGWGSHPASGGEYDLVTFPLAKSEADELAKGFKISENGCRIYVYMKRAFTVNLIVDVAINSGTPFLLNDDTYYYTNSEPGPVTLEANLWKKPAETDWGIWKKPAETEWEIWRTGTTTVECQPERLVTIELDPYRTWVTQEDLYLKHVDTDRGKAQIRKRRLILWP
jgi:hypothetical protein